MFRNNFFWILKSFLKDKEIEVFNKKLELINFEINILNILLEIINLILDINNDHYIILILDQYKSSNIDSDLSFINNLKKSNERKNFKVIICSSINDNEMRDELIQTWYDNRGNPIELNEKTQDYVFYYSKLYIPEASKTLSFLLFNNKLNYSKLFDERNILNSLNKINDKITNKLKKFKKYVDKSEISNNIFNINDILLFMKKIINIEHQISLLLNLVSSCPLKYFVVNFKNDCFIITP